MSDESLREFQLNGKQLVFLFMASTIVAVVIFLCGVMVGRGVSTAQASTVADGVAPLDDPTAGGSTLAPVVAESGAPSDTPPEPAAEDVPRYPDVLTGPRPAGTLEAPSNPAPARAAQPASAVRAGTAVAAAAPRASTAQPADTEPGGDGFVVQVVATPRRAEADGIRTRLQQKGYPAFVTTTGSLFRVRVGKYSDRDEANTIAKRLETEERFKPWVTR